MKEGKWATPLGELDIDHSVAAELASEFSFTVETTSDYEPENTIELQLPFIKYFFPQTRIVPLGLPPRAASLEIGKRAIQISKGMGRKTVVFGSTDLTHYGANYGFSPQGHGEEAVHWVKYVNDKRVVDLMLGMDAGELIEESLQNRNACCAGAAGSAIVAAKELGATRADKIVYSTSYDIRPDTSFVGYVGIVFLA
jgi:AmmeMemoRadiSam system protein B